MVTLRFVGSPGMACTSSLQASSSEASSVHSRGPSAGYRSKAARSSERRTPWGVWATASDARSTVVTTSSPARRLTVSMIGTTGIAAPCRAAVAATRSMRSGEGTGRAPSWTRTTRSVPSGGGSSRLDAAHPAATDSCRRRPPGTTARTVGGSQDASRTSARESAATTTHDPTDDRRGRQRGQGPGQQRPPADLGQDLVDPGHPTGRARGDDDGVGTAGRRGGPVGGRPARGRQSSRGWAKIIRPATVWSTRVTVTSRSVLMIAAAAFHDDHRAVVEEADALAALLALLDDPDPELLAGQHHRLDGVGQRLMFSTRTPCSSATRFRLKSLVMIAPLSAWPAAPAWRRPRGRPAKSSSTISTGVGAIPSAAG